MRNGKIRINTLLKFLFLCKMTIQECRFPTVNEIMKYNFCSRSNAYNYLRALHILFSEEELKKERKKKTEISKNRKTICSTYDSAIPSLTIK